MAQNKNALIRYKTIDKCLQNTYRKWTLNDLIEACSDALYEYEGRDVDVSRRSIQLDIQLMRSDKLGYNAPIEVYDRKYYRYSEEGYTITDIPITESDMQVLSESVEVLRQFKDFSLFSELGGIIQRLEDKIYMEKTHRSAIIHLERNEHLQGLEHLDVLYQAILKQVCLLITYKSFSAAEPSEILFHPFILKEFNNRWFLVGKRHNQRPVITLALDRIISIDYDLHVPHCGEAFDGDAYYQHTVGVTVMGPRQLREVFLRVDAYNAPYVLTKPLHRSQELQKREADGSIVVKIRAHLNYELERLILGFGDSMTVLGPAAFRKRMAEKIERSLANYTVNKAKREPAVDL